LHLNLYALLRVQLDDKHLVYRYINYFSVWKFFYSSAKSILIYIKPLRNKSSACYFQDSFVSFGTFAFFFSSAFAGIWEIFEFTADRLAGGDMQRGMVDTVTDIIAGNLGALTYFLIFTVLILAGKARIDDKLLN